jgi:hypothetical protein
VIKCHGGGNRTTIGVTDKNGPVDAPQRHQPCDRIALSIRKNVCIRPVIGQAVARSVHEEEMRPPFQGRTKSIKRIKQTGACSMDENERGEIRPVSKQPKTVQTEAADIDTSSTSGVRSFPASDKRRAWIAHASRAWLVSQTHGHLVLAFHHDRATGQPCAA